jgi:uncharacterized protein involved in exopolysaccharide biosynthesis
MSMQEATNSSAPVAGPDALDLLLEIARHGRLIIGGGLLVGVLALGASYLIKPTFTSSTVILPPQQQQSLASSALSSLGALAGLAGGAAGGLRSPIDQYVAMLRSTTLADRMIDRFNLLEVYEETLRFDARALFWERSRVSAGRRDGLITIEVDDKDPKRAAEMAAAMVEEFRRMTSELVITEAQQRRSFFEKQVQATRDKLTAAQQALQSSGLTAGTLKAEPKAAAEGYAKLKAEATAAQVRLQALLTNLTANAPEVQQQQSLLAALNAELRKQEANVSQQDADSGYIGKYREFKYQEVLFELFLRQYEMARLDEGREGGLTQVVDVAQVPEKKSKPKRAFIGLGASVAAGLVLLVFVLIRAQLRMSDASGEARAKLAKLLPALVGRG